MREDKFWFVWNGNGLTPPKFKHTSESSAREEAARLARLNRGHTFVVLESKASVQSTDVQWWEYDWGPQQIPF